MKNIKLGYSTTREDWRDIVEQLRDIPGVTVADMPEVDKEGLFVDYQYITIEYMGRFHYIQKETLGGCFTCTPYIKVSPWERVQAGYPESVTTLEQLIHSITHCKAGKPLRGCPRQRLYLTDGFYTIDENGTTGMQRFRSAMGFREKEIFARLARIENIMTTEHYKVLRFCDENGDWFDWECKSGRITQ